MEVNFKSYFGFSRHAVSLFRDRTHATSIHFISINARLDKLERSKNSTSETGMTGSIKAVAGRVGAFMDGDNAAAPFGRIGCLSADGSLVELTIGNQKNKHRVWIDFR